MYARQHSPLLLQVTSTNPIEAWHRRIKQKQSKQTKSKFSLKGACQVIHMHALQLDTYKNKIALNVRGSYLSRTDQYPEMCRFPIPVQKLLLQQLNSVQGRIIAGKTMPQISKLVCHCNFFMKYLLLASISSMQIFFLDWV